MRSIIILLDAHLLKSRYKRWQHALLASICFVSCSAFADAVRYEYDALGRLKSAVTSKDGSGSSYSYDKAGNRIAESTIAALDATVQLSGVDFGSRPLGLAVVADAVLTNGGEGSVNIPLTPTVDGAGFRYVGTTCGAKLAAKERCAITIEYSPLDPKIYSGRVFVRVASRDLSAVLSGTGVPPGVDESGFTPSSGLVGKAANFRWRVSNATSAKVSCSGVGVNATQTDLSGTLSVVPTDAGVITCRVDATAGSQSSSRTATYEATYLPFDVQLASTARTVSPAQKFKILSGVSGQDAECVASNDTEMGWAGVVRFTAGVPLSSNDLVIAKSTTFSLDCLSAMSKTRLIKSVRVEITPAPFDISLVPTTATVDPGQSVRLTSSVVGEDATCEASNSSGASWQGAFFLRAGESVQSRDVQLSSTTSFTLRCTSISSNVTRSQSVEVRYRAPPSFDASLVASSLEVKAGQSVTLTSTVMADDANCTASNDTGLIWQGKFALQQGVPAQSGAVPVYRPTTFTLQCVAVASGVSLSRSVYVNVMP